MSNIENYENKQNDIIFLTKLEAAQNLLLEKKYKEAKARLLEILQYKNDREARKLLVQLKKRQKIKAFRIALIAIFIVTGIALVFLGLKKVSSTEVAMDLTVDQISFTTVEDLEIYSVEAQTIGLSHLGDLELYPTKVERAIAYHPDTDQPIKWQVIASQDTLQIKRAEDFWNVTLQSNYLNLSSLVVDSGSTVTVGINERKPGQLLVTIINGKVFGTVETGDAFILVCNSCEIGSQFNKNNVRFHTLRILSQHREIEFTGLNKFIDITLALPENQSKSNHNAFGKNIYIKKVDFTRLTGEQRESTITQEGKIYFAELDGKELGIKEDDFLIISGLQAFEIKRLFWENQIKVSLYGKVQKLESGTRTSLHSRLPSYLERLYTNRPLIISLAFLIAAITAILSILQLLKIIEEL